MKQLLTTLSAASLAWALACATPAPGAEPSLAAGEKDCRTQRHCRFPVTGVEFERPAGFDWWIYYSRTEPGPVPTYGLTPTGVARISGHPGPSAFFPKDQRIQLAIATFAAGGRSLADWCAERTRDAEKQDSAAWARRWLKARPGPCAARAPIAGQSAVETGPVAFTLDHDVVYAIWSENPGHIDGFEKIRSDFIASLSFEHASPAPAAPAPLPAKALSLGPPD